MGQTREICWKTYMYGFVESTEYCMRKSMIYITLDFAELS